MKLLLLIWLEDVTVLTNMAVSNMLSDLHSSNGRAAVYRFPEVKQIQVQVAKKVILPFYCLLFINNGGMTLLGWKITEIIMKETS